MKKFSELKLIDKILIIGFLGIAMFLLLFTFGLKRTDKNFYLPEGYVGWVNIKSRFPGAAELPIKNGAYQIHVPDSGYIVTSSILKDGWGRDKFYWMTADGPKEIPHIVEMKDSPDGYGKYIHAHEYHHYSHAHILEGLAVGTDTMMWDNTRLIRKSEERVDYREGSKSIEFFYVSDKPLPISRADSLPSNPVNEKLDLQDGSWMKKDP